jgi:hypothetical protein
VNTIRNTASAPEASKAAGELLSLTSEITSGLDSAREAMRAIMKSEGL